MVNFRINKKLDLKKFLRKDTSSEKDNIPLKIKLKEPAQGLKGSNNYIRTFGNLLLIAGGVFMALFIFSRVEKGDSSSVEVVYLENFQRDILEDIKNLKNSIDINSSRVLV